MAGSRAGGWLVLAALLGGCSSSSSGAPADEPPKPPLGTLRRTASCDDLAAALKADAKAKLEKRTQAAISFLRAPSTKPVFASPTGDTTGTGTNGGTNSTGTPAAGTSPGTGGAGTPSTGTSGASPPPVGGSTPAHSTTTTQVDGVDEADIVENDGTYLYILHGRSLVITDAWPVASLAVASTTEIEGAPIEMYVTPGYAVVFSQVDPTPVLSAAGLAPKPAVHDDYVSGSALVPESKDAPGGETPMTKITVLALQGANASVLAEHWVEGSYVSSRRVGTSVRVVVNGVAHGPVVDDPATPPSTEDELNAAELAGEKKIDQASPDDFVPLGAKRVNGQMLPAPPSCDEFYVPSVGSSEVGVLRVVSLDLASPGETHGATIIGRADTVYGDKDTLWIAARPYLDKDVVAASALTPGAPATPVPLDETIVHEFDVSDPAAPKYVASGTIEGRVPDQFAMDEKSGTLRIATTGQRVVPPTSLAGGSAPAPITPDQVSHLVVLTPSGTSLNVLGSAGDVAEGDQIRATRFVGDHAFLVTERTVNPLVAIDVSNAKSPSVVGTIDIPGFSEFVQPMDDTHLLTIGRDTTAGATATALSLSVFDVSNPAAPAIVQHFAYTGMDGYSVAETNQKAFTYWADRGLVAFPFVGIEAGGLAGLKSTLEVFSVSADGGFTKLGSIDASQFFQNAPNGWCNGNFGVDVRRGTFIEDTVFAVSYGGIVAAKTSDPSTAIATLALPPPVGPSWLCGM